MHGAGLEVRAAHTTPSKNIQWVTRHFPPSTLMARLRCHLLHSVGEMRHSLLGCQGGLLMEVHQQLTRAVEVPHSFISEGDSQTVQATSHIWGFGWGQWSRSCSDVPLSWLKYSHRTHNSGVGSWVSSGRWKWVSFSFHSKGTLTLPDGSSHTLFLSLHCHYSVASFSKLV